MRLTLSIVLGVLIIILVGLNTVYSECPSCDVTYASMVGSGSGPNGKILAQIYIDGSWNVDANGNAISGTNSNIWNAVVGYHDSNVNMNGATEMWNNATSNGNQINYNFQVNQSFFSHTDIYILRGNPVQGCADIGFNLETGAWEMHLADSIKNLPHEWIAALIAHELGHALGLYNAVNDDCINTIMQGHYAGGCEPIVKAITAQDVDSARQHYSDRTHCDVQTQPTVIPNPAQTPTPTPAPLIEGGAALCNDGIDNDENGLTDCEEDGCFHYCSNGCSQWQWEVCMRLGAAGCYDGNCYTPILVDVAGNGFQLSSARNGVVFNLLPAMPVKIAWTTPNSDDAWLALDRNGNSEIDSGDELFGNSTPQPTPPDGAEKNGFLALAEYDSPATGGNGDGVIDQRDAVFTSLQLWQDINHNGISESSELHGLSDLGIATVELRYRESKRTDEFGNDFRYRAKVKDVKGAQIGRWAWDVFLKMAP